MDREDVLRFIEDNDVKFIRLQFTDITGRLKNTAITETHIEKAFDGIYFDGSAVEGFGRAEESDMLLVPDLDTLALIPWRPQQGKVARLICDVLGQDGTPFDGDPRQILRRAVRQAAGRGYTFNVGPECEFFLFNTDDHGQPTIETHDKAGYFDLAPIDLGENARREMCLVLEDMGFEIEASHHEVASGQHEIDFRYDEAMKAADNIMTFKMVVKIVAQKHGLHATFMPKPFHDQAGSGMHINMSLFRGGNNEFYDPENPQNISQQARYFIGGIFAHIKAITALSNPLVNSYKRLIAGFEAPIYITWAHRNRSPLIRIPAFTGSDARLELRSPDPACNPYLVLAVVLAARLQCSAKQRDAPLDLHGEPSQMWEA
ncbi:MAG: type I glutamate--ammonia ligase, partial [Clostridia bacterium]|nr:type I glutamate--ammonia ligase [Clostridia bacterium]